MKYITTILLVGVLIVQGFSIYNKEDYVTQGQHNRDLLYVQNQIPDETFGAANNAVGGKLYFLSGSGISTTQTTIGLTAFAIAGGTQLLTMTNFGALGCGTVEPGHSTRQEFVSFTDVTQNSDGTATLTGVTRGLSPVIDYTASTTQQKAHSGGSRFVISNSPPCFYEDYASLTQNEAVTGAWTYNSNLPSSTLAATTTNQLTNKAYVDNVTNAGAATSTETNGGIVELATQLEVASSTDGGSDKPLVLQARYATSTPTASTGLHVAVGQNNGKLHQLWLDLTEAFTWTGNHIFNTGSVTFNNTVDIEADAAANFTINTVAYAFPSADGTASSTLQTDGSGTLSWAQSSELATSTHTGASVFSSTASTTVFTFSVPANTLGTNGAVKVKINFSDIRVGSTAGIIHFELNYGGSTQNLSMRNTSAGDSGVMYGTAEITLVASNATGAQESTIAINTSSGNNIVLNSDDNGRIARFLETKAHTVDSTSAQTFSLIMRNFESETATGFTIDNIVAEYIK